LKIWIGLIENNKKSINQKGKLRIRKGCLVIGEDLL